MCKELFKRIDSVIRSERLYANVDLMREDVMKRFSISRHRLNDLLNQHAGGLSFPQYINKMRVDEAREQFQLSDYKRLIDIYSSTAKTVDALMKLELPSGVEVEIKV